MSLFRHSIVQRNPTLEEFAELINAVGWSRYTNLETISKAIEASLVAVVAISESKVIGMGRLVGDGHRCVYVQDIVVHPDFQRKGIGTAIMDYLMNYISENCPRKTYIHLFTDKADAPFYARYGFQGPEKSFYGMSLKKFAAPIKRKNANVRVG